MQTKLADLNIPLFMLKGKAEDTIPKMVKDTKAALLVVDFSPLRDGRKWRDEVGSYPWTHQASVRFWM